MVHLSHEELQSYTMKALHIAQDKSFAIVGIIGHACLEKLDTEQSKISLKKMHNLITLYQYHPQIRARKFALTDEILEQILDHGRGVEKKAAVSVSFADDAKDDADMWKERQRQMELELMAWDEHILRNRGIGLLDRGNQNTNDSESGSRSA